MVIDNDYGYISKNFLPGDEIWACNGLNAMIPPVKGVVCCDKRKPSRGYTVPKPNDIWRFVPYDVNGSLKWGSIRDIDTRFFAITEEECCELYCQQLLQQLKNIEKRILKVKSELGKYK